MEFDIEKILYKYKHYKEIGHIKGNETEHDFDVNKFNDVREINREVRERLNFVNHANINYSGVESDDFKKRIEKTEEKEFLNRLYIANNYRGFGYKKNLEDFEETTFNILKSSIAIVDADKEKKDLIISRLQENLMQAFKDKTLSNAEVKEKIEVHFNEIEEEFNIKLTDNIAKCSFILIDRFRLSLYNLKESDLNTKYKDNLMELESKNLNLLTNNLKEINAYLPQDDKISLKKIMMELGVKDRLPSDFVDSVIVKMGLNNPSTQEEKETKELYLKKMMDIEVYGANIEKYAKELSTLNKHERLSSIALNFILAEKNGMDAKKIDYKIGMVDFIDSFSNIIQGKNESDKNKKILLDKISKNLKNENRLNGYVDRVHERINSNDKLNFAFEKDEIKNAIIQCAKMFEDYANSNQGEDAFFKKLNEVVEEKISSTDGNLAYKDADIMETISNSLKDNLYNKLISETYKNSEKANDYKINVLKNLENNKYGFDTKKNEDVLSCDNMQKIFKMISSKTLTTQEALALLENNKDILKNFSQQERNSVIDLIEDISKVKKQEALLRKNNTPYKDYLFEDLKKKDIDYDARMKAAEDLKRKHISHILNDGKLSDSNFAKTLSNLTALNGPAIVELKYCAEKQVETRKMDTGLSMASQCLDTYKQKTESTIKELEQNLKQNLSNPMVTMSGLSTFILLLYIIQKGRLTTENYEILKNEEEITKVVNHIDSVNEQKIKDGLTILYKLKSNDSKKVKPVSYSVEKELFMDTKKDLFFSELLIKSKDTILTENGRIPLYEIVYSNDNALDNFKDILNSGTLRYDLDKIAKELRIREEKMLEDKAFSYLMNEEKHGREVVKFKENEIAELQKNLDEAVSLYKKTMQNTMPELHNELENSKNLFNPENIGQIKDEKTQSELRGMLRNVYSIQDTMKVLKNDLTDINSKMKLLKRERESISPFIDILNEDKTAISSQKLNDAIKENPDKVLSMFNNLDSINRSNEPLNTMQKNEIREIKQKLFFNIIDRAANKNNSDLLTSDFFNDIITKAIPHNKNLIEEISDFNFTSSEHPNSDKIILNISKKDNHNLYDSYKELLKDSTSSFIDTSLESLREKLEGKSLSNMISSGIENFIKPNKNLEEATDNSPVL